MGSKGKKPKRIKPRIPRGFRDIPPGTVHARAALIDRIRRVYESFGFSPLETPALEYVDCLGKFLPEADQPDAGIFAFRDDDEEWVALRYDLTAPLARYVAMNPELPRPFRRYQVGPVYRVEKPGPGRFREFYQFDFDTVGSNSMLADAECAMIMADTLAALGFATGEYLIRINNRKILNGVLELVAGIGGLSNQLSLQVLRSIDKLDKVGIDGVKALLGRGRKDDSGAFIKGVGLETQQIDAVGNYLSERVQDRSGMCDILERQVGDTEIGRKGIEEIREIDDALRSAGYGDDRVVFDPTVVRGLEYYTGPVFEGTLTLTVEDDKGRPRDFGSVVAGGRYDGLVQRFTGQEVPATGASIGVDRLLATLEALGKSPTDYTAAPVIVTRMDRDLTPVYQALAAELRGAGINTELYAGNQNIGKQFKYAGDTGRTVALVMGSDEQERGEVSIKDLRLGVELSREVGADRKKWLEEQPAQFSVKRDQVVAAVQDVLARYSG